MKNVLLFHFEACPYCVAARKWVKELQQEYPELAQIPIEMIDEKREPEKADAYDYWYVPTLFVDGKKLHEGAATKEKIERVLRAAL